MHVLHAFKKKKLANYLHFILKIVFDFESKLVSILT